MAIRAKATTTGARPAKNVRRAKAAVKTAAAETTIPPSGTVATLGSKGLKAAVAKGAAPVRKKPAKRKPKREAAGAAKSNESRRAAKEQAAELRTGVAATPTPPRVGAPRSSSGRARVGTIPGPPTPEILGIAGISPDVDLSNLDWDDERPSSPESIPELAPGLVSRWVERGQELLLKLQAMEAADYEYRADLRDGRFVWLSPEGHVAVEAKAKVVCSWARSTSVVVMAWVDPLMREVGISRVEGMASEMDDVNEAGAWHAAMRAAEACVAEYIYRVPTPHASYFLALWELRPSRIDSGFCPSTPVGLVLRELSEIRSAVASRAEPSDVVRERLLNAGSALIYQADYAYRTTEWVGRLRRTGQTLTKLSRRLSPPTYSTIAAGRPAEEWISPDVASELVGAVALLEDEWTAFS